MKEYNFFIDNQRNEYSSTKILKDFLLILLPNLKIDSHISLHLFETYNN